MYELNKKINFKKIDNPDKPNIESIKLYSNNKPVKIDLYDLLKKVDIMYDEKNDTVSIDFKTNLLIKANNSIFVSKKDTLIISGDVIGSKGKIYLNPVLSVFKVVKDNVNKFIKKFNRSLDV